MKAIVTVVGKDQVGIIAGVCNKLADHQINVLDISQTILDGFFNMIMLVDISECNISLQELVDECARVGKEIGLEVRCQHEDIFKFMHQV